MNLIREWLSNLLGDGNLKTIRVIATTEPKCNLACEHCYWPHNLAHAPECDWKDAVEYLKVIQVPLFFAGRILNERGAKFLRRVIEEKASPEIGIVDNGLTIADYPEFFPHYSSINVSIDGWKEEHDRQRRKKGLFDMAWRTVMDLKEKGLDPIISAAISPITMSKWEKFEELCIAHNVPMSSTPVLDLPETVRRGKANFSSAEGIRDAFKRLANGMPKLINIYSLEYVQILKDELAGHEWTIDDETGDCLRATLPSRTMLIYRPTSLTSIGEVLLKWDGECYTPFTWGPERLLRNVEDDYFTKVAEQNKKELAVWSEITPLVKKGGE